MRISTLIFLFIMTSSLRAQETWKVFNQGNSPLTSDLVISIAIDSQNHKWFNNASMSLDEYDGGNWKNHPNDVINGSHGGLVAIDSKGNKWIGSASDGLSFFDGTTWKNYNTSNSGIPSNAVYSVVVDKKDQIWVGTKGGGLAKFFNDNWVLYHEGNSNFYGNIVYCLALDSHDNLWIGTPYNGIFKFDGVDFINYNIFNSDNPANDIYAIAVDKDDRVWSGSENNGIAIFDGNTWKNYNTSNSGLVENYIRCFEFGQPGEVWIGTSNSGLMKFNGTTWKNYNTSNSGIPNNKIWGIKTESNKNKIWIATLGGGVAYLDLRSSLVDVNYSLGKLNLSPNPFVETAYINIEQPVKNATLYIYNAVGQLVREEKNVSGTIISIERNNLQSGLYTVNITENNKAIGQCKFILCGN